MSFPEEAGHVEDEAEEARSSTHPPCRCVHVHLKWETSLFEIQSIIDDEYFLDELEDSKKRKTKGNQ